MGSSLKLLHSNHNRVIKLRRLPNVPDLKSSLFKQSPPLRLPPFLGVKYDLHCYTQGSRVSTTGLAPDRFPCGWSLSSRSHAVGLQSGYLIPEDANAGLIVKVVCASNRVGSVSTFPDLI